MNGHIIAPSPTIWRARMRLAQAEAIIAGLSTMHLRISALFRRAPAARGERAMAIRRAWLRASA